MKLKHSLGLMVLLVTVLFFSCTPQIIETKTFPQVNDSDHVYGDLEKAEIVIISYMNPGAPYCREFKKTVQEIISEQEGKIVWVYRHFSLPFMHSEYRPVMLSMEYISAELGSATFWESVDSFYTIDTYSGDDIRNRTTQIAQSFLIDSLTLWTSINNVQFSNKIKRDSLLGVESKISGIPYSFVYNRNGQEVNIVGSLSKEEIYSILTSL